jgi:hypothetical protein
MVEGARGAEAHREAEAPPTALRAVPLPASRGGIKISHAKPITYLTRRLC